ncbi:tetratricopeptide repeat protein 28-like, partial [Orbicella faveolata]|uniref:tetratricopeptide repeat protein 28-like n=1 Tax=Orbicella faveolata TaxID=48498 RepID=UPI0009E4A476
MADVDEILQVLFVGIAVASILLQTRRFMKAIELLSECLVLLKKHSLKLKKDKLNELFALVYDRQFNLYCLVGDYKNAIQSGEEALCLFRENDDYGGEAVLLNKMGDVYLSIGENGKAKESFEKARTYYLNEVSRLQQGEHLKRTFATLLCNLGEYSIPLYEFTSAKDYFEQALAIWEEIGDRQGKERALSFLSELNYLVSDSKKAAQNEEQAIPVYQTGGSESGAGLLIGKIDDVCQSTGEQVEVKESYEEAVSYIFNEMMNVYEVLFLDQRENFERLLSEANTQGKETIAGFLYRSGTVSLSRFEYPKAKDYLERAREVFRETGNRKNEPQVLIALGNLYKENEEYEQAKIHYEEAMVIAEDVGETFDKGVAYGKLGTLCDIRGEYAKAKELHMKALEISVELGDKKGEITDHLNFAKVHINLSERDQARECYRKALKISKEIGSQEAEASTYFDLGVFSCSLSDYENAEFNLKKALEMYRKIGDTENEGSSICQLGYLYFFVGRYHEAIKCYERKLDISKIIGDKIGEGTAYCNLGTAYQALGDYGKAKKCHQQALDITTKTNHVRGQAIDYGNLGTVYQHLGNYEAAYKHHEKALEIKTRIDHKEGLSAEYLNLGVVCQYLGEFVKANECCQKALAIAKKIGDRRVEANILCRLGSIEQTIGEHERATEHYKEAFQISKEVKDIRQEGEINCNLGSVYQSLGDLTTAKRYLEKSLAITKQIGSKDSEGAVLNNLGGLHHSLGAHAEARECYEMSLALSIETRNQELEMTTNNNLGSLHLSENEFHKGSECFKRAVRISEQMGDVKGKIRSYCNLAVVYVVSAQDMPKALKYLSASIKALEEMRVLVGESEYYKIGLADENAAPYRLMVTVLLKLECIEMALNVSELERARSLAESMATKYSIEQLPGFNPNRWVEFGNFIQRKSCTGLSFYFVHENLLCWVLKTGKVEVVTNKGLTTDIRPQGESIQRWLETLAHQTYRDFLLLQGERCEDRSLFLWDDDAEARSPTQVKETPTTSRGKEHEEEGQKDPPALKELYNMIIAPVREFVEGSEMIIVPDRSLHRIPFAALKDESGEYLSEKFRIRIIPSLTTLKLIQDSPATYHSQKGVLIVGDPEVGLEELPP